MPARIKRTLQNLDAEKALLGGCKKIPPDVKDPINAKIEALKKAKEGDNADEERQQDVGNEAELGEEAKERGDEAAEVAR